MSHQLTCANVRCDRRFVPHAPTQVYCSGACRNRARARMHYWRHRPGEPAPAPVRRPAQGGYRQHPDRPNYWGWAAVVATLEAEVDASVAQMARAVYGSDDERSRRAMAMALCDLARAGVPYPGGPWVVRVARGRYALPADRTVYPSKGRVAVLLRQRARALPELAFELGLHPMTVLRWIADLVAEGVPVVRGTRPEASTKRHWQRVYRIETKARVAA